MLKLDVPASEFYDSGNNEFVKIDGGVLILEHSLLSISKWESKWCKSFLSDNNKSKEELFDYLKCMTVNNVDESIYMNLNDKMMEQVISYINAPMTATTFSKNSGNSKEVITNEIIYYWMFSLGIDKECEKWHLSRLLTLIRVCSEKNAPKKRMSNKEIYSQQKAINEARRRKFNTKG